MAAPTDFDPQPRSTSDRPPPAPPRILKHQIYTDPHFFKAVDDHAIMVAQTHYSNFRDLIKELVFGKNFNELQKARAIFRWMTLKAVHDNTFDNELRQDSPGAILQGFQSRTDHFHKAFECLSLYAGLHCVILSGWVKASYDEPGVQSTLEPKNHCWNAVHIDGNWQLIDTYWATMSNEDAPGEYKDFYFIPDPSEFIYTHYPEDPAWQLLQPSRSKVEFDEYPIVSSKFFPTGMYFLQQNKGVIYTHGGILVLTLGLKKLIDLSFELKCGDEASFQGVPLLRYMLQETTNKRVSYYFRAPEEGTYYLTVHAREIPENLIMETDYSKVCKYKIICNDTAGEVKPFPSSFDSYSSGVHAMQCGLLPFHQKAILQTTNGKTEVAFTKSFPIEMFAVLRNEERTEQQLTNAISIEEEDDQICIKCDLPAPGEYGLNIFAKEYSDEGPYLRVCQYLVSYTDQDPLVQYGQLYDQEDSSDLVKYNYDPYTYADLTDDLYQAGTSGDIQASSAAHIPGNAADQAPQEYVNEDSVGLLEDMLIAIRFDTDMKAYVIETLEHKRLKLFVVFDDGDVKEIDTEDGNPDEKTTDLTSTTPGGHVVTPPPSDPPVDPPQPPEPIVMTSTTPSDHIDTSPPSDPPQPPEPMTRSDTLPPPDGTTSSDTPTNTTQSPEPSDPSSIVSAKTRTSVTVVCVVTVGLACIGTAVLVLWCRKRRAIDQGNHVMMNAVYDANAALVLLDPADADDEIVLLDRAAPNLAAVERPQGAGRAAAAEVAAEGPVASRTRQKTGPGIPPYMPVFQPQPRLDPYREEGAEYKWPSWDDRKRERADTPGSDDSGLRARPGRRAAAEANERIRSKKK